MVGAEEFTDLQLKSSVATAINGGEAKKRYIGSEKAKATRME